MNDNVNANTFACVLLCFGSGCYMYVMRMEFEKEGEH